MTRLSRTQGTSLPSPVQPLLYDPNSAHKEYKCQGSNCSCCWLFRCQWCTLVCYKAGLIIIIFIDTESVQHRGRWRSCDQHVLCWSEAEACEGGGCRLDI